MNVLFLAAEASPFASTGGLGEVIASLPLALNALARDSGACRFDCRVLLPAYQKISLPCKTLSAWTMEFDGKATRVILKEAIGTELPLYLLDIPSYFARDQLYGYSDDVLRFGAFCQAALYAQKYFCDHDWNVDVVHCHDWHTALFPIYRNIHTSSFNTPGKVLLTIHNLAYQGICDAIFLPSLGLPPTLFNMHEMEFWGKLNPFKGGIVFADAISTVSPTYMKEIQTKEFGCGLEDALQQRKDRLFGVLNGIDQETWNPQKDIYLTSHYSAQDITGKATCKNYLQECCGLQTADKTPLIGMVTRLTAQKGIDLLIAAFDQIMTLGIQLVILGDGEPELIERLKARCHKYRTQVSLTTGVFDVALAHQIYAGSDLFLMPSRFEPCGLAQMISMRYGTVPIVRKTGGLADTVHPYSAATNSGNGFVVESYEPKVLFQAVREAVNCYKSHDWKALQRNAFAADFSWRQSATEYEKIYRSL